MDSVTNVSSEEELLDLLNEGKITRDEYEELLETLRKSAKVNVGPEAQDKAKPSQTPGLAIAALVLALALGPLGSIPAVICGHLALRKIRKEPALGGRGLALAGLIIGYVVLGLFTIPLIVWVCFDEQAERIEPFSMSPAELEGSLLPPVEITELQLYPLDNIEGVLTQSGVTLDRQISSDGNGSLRIEATKPTTVRLFQTGDMDIEDARLIYQAHLRTENVEGQVYLEMWCHIAGLGDSFSKGLDSPLTGSTEWVTEEIPFFLKKGENPDNVKLNLVITGTGTVWIDDIRLLKSAAPLF